MARMWRKKQNRERVSYDPLHKPMMNCRASHDSSTSTVEVDEEIITSSVHRAIRVVKSSETPTLQKAAITANELVKHPASREKPMEIDESQSC